MNLSDRKSFTGSLLVLALFISAARGSRYTSRLALFGKDRSEKAKGRLSWWDPLVYD